MEEPPTLVSPLNVNYPYGMRASGLEGAVVVEFVINSKGDVVEARAVKSNNRWFERAALEAIQRAKFKPGRINGRPVNTRAQQTIVFHLDPTQKWTVKKSSNHDTLPEQFRWDVPPEVKHSAFPAYPFDALLAKRKGKAAVGFIIAPDGNVAAARVIEATEPEMGQAAIAAVELWKFDPARKKGGIACAATVRMDFEFDPNGRGNVPVTPGAHTVLKQLRKSPQAIVGAAQLDAVPQVIVTDSPAYPLAFQAANREGEALIEFFVDENGDAQLPRIVQASEPEFGHAALQAVATWRFTPPLVKGRPTITRVQMPLIFKPSAD